MRSTIGAVSFILLFFFMFVFFPSSCSDEALSDPFEYTKSDIDAEICANVDGEELEATIQSRPASNGDEPLICIRFTAPRALENVTVMQKIDGKTEARLNELIIENDHLKGLIEPFEAYFTPCDVFSVRRGSEGETYVSVCDENCDLEYVFDKNCVYPRRVIGNFRGRSIELVLKSIVFLN